MGLFGRRRTGDLSYAEALRRHDAAERRIGLTEAAQSIERRQLRRMLVRRLRWQRARRVLALLLVLAVLGALSLLSGVVQVRRHAASGYTVATCAPWPACVARDGPRRLAASWSAALRTLGLGPPTRDVTPRARFNPVGVHICARSSYDARSLRCRSDLHGFTAAHLGRVYLSVVGQHGRPFSGRYLQVSVVCVNAAGHPVHRYRVVVALTSASRQDIARGVWAVSLADLARRGARGFATPGSYVVSVADRRSLGRTRFDIVR